MNQKTRNYLSVSPEALLGFLEDNYTFEVPVGIDSEIAMRQAGNLLAVLSNAYSYLASMNAALSIYTKRLKNECPPKPKKGTPQELYEYETRKSQYEEMKLRKDILEQYVDILKQQYSCVSRMITVKIEADRELKMSESRSA